MDKNKSMGKIIDGGFAPLPKIEEEKPIVFHSELLLKVKIPGEVLDDILTSAFEGGITY